MFKLRKRKVNTTNTDQDTPRVLGGHVRMWFDEKGAKTSVEYYNRDGDLFKEVYYRPNGALRTVEHYNGERSIKTEYFDEDGCLVRVQHYDGEEVVRVEQIDSNGEITIG